MTDLGIIHVRVLLSNADLIRAMRDLRNWRPAFGISLGNQCGKGSINLEGGMQPPQMPKQLERKRCSKRWHLKLDVAVLKQLSITVILF
jgi:hypothetical protein